MRATAVVAGLAVAAVLGGGAAEPAPAAAAPVAHTVLAEEPELFDDVLLPDEGEPAPAEEYTDWETDRTLTRPWLLDPCSPTSYPTDGQRLRFRTVSREGPEVFDARQLGVYPTPEVAAEVVAGFRRVLDACRTGRTDDGAEWTWATAAADDLGDEGFLAASTSFGPQVPRGGERIAVTRVRNAVFLAHAFGEFYSAEIDEGAQEVREVAQRFVESV